MLALASLLISCTSIAVSKEASGGNAAKEEARTFIGRNSCEQVFTGIDKPDRRRQLTMVVGAFISGSNYARSRNSQMPLKNMLTVTERYCKQHPDKPFLYALVTLDKVLDKQLELLEKKP
jgi:hypothetical protein